MRLQDITNILPEKRTFQSTKRLSLNRRNIGIEIELEGLHKERTSPPLWSLVGDGSLRNGGVELVSAVLRGEDIVTALGTAESFATESNLVVSDRCSVHIHLDVRHLDREELVLLVIMYCVFEDVFFVQGGDIDRKENNHCRPICSSQALVGALRDFMLGSASTASRAINRWNKYTALNLLPVNTQGSIEFRHHVGTYSSEEILKWINLIFSLASFARKNKSISLQRCIDRVCLSPEELFNEVLSPLQGQFTEEIRTTMLNNARFIQVVLATPTPAAHEDVQVGSISTSRGLNSGRINRQFRAALLGNTAVDTE